jgi:5-carboxymethyl-2-hydroxymuconate isomerase
MPHITIEYTANLTPTDEDWVLLQVNKSLLGLGIFMDSDIKTRMRRLEAYRVGVDAGDSGEHAFIAATVELLSGRDFSVKEHLGQVLLRTLERSCQAPPGLQLQISVHLKELRSDLYFKSVKGGARPAGQDPF